MMYKKLSHLFLALVIVLATSTHLNAQTSFIKYKKYLIPIGTGLNTCLAGSKPRVIVSTDLAGFGQADDDDIQSMIHYLVSSYRFETLGFISSPGRFETGLASDIQNVINEYAKDYSELSSVDSDYPAPSSLVVKQGMRELPDPYPSHNDDVVVIPTFEPSDSEHQGAKLIIDEATKVLNGQACGPIYLRMWGPITDLVIALEAHPEIAPVLRVYASAASNRDTDLDTYNFLTNNYLMQDLLWFVEVRNTHFGIHIPTASNPGAQAVLDKQESTKNALSVFGCLGQLLDSTLTDYQGGGGLDGFTPKSLKAGDTPSILRLINGDLNNPSSDSWGGKFRLVAGTTQYWRDQVNTSLAIDSVGKHVGSISNSNSIYGDWYQNMQRAGIGCDSN